MCNVMTPGPDDLGPESPDVESTEYSANSPGPAAAAESDPGEENAAQNAGSTGPSDANPDAADATPDAATRGDDSPGAATLGDATPDAATLGDDSPGAATLGDATPDAASLGDDSPGATGRARRRGLARSTPIPGPDDCLRAMAHAAGLVAMNMLEPARANAIGSLFGRILQHHKAQGAQAGEGLGNATVLDIARTHPDLLSVLEPLLTDSQIELLMRQSPGADDAQG